MENKTQLLNYFHQLTDPLTKYRKPHEGRFHLGSSATHYDRGQTDAEGFLRTLWAVGPLAGAGEISPEDFAYYKDAILHSVDPKDPAYWGEIQDFDQLIVEMAALSVTLIETKEIFWDTLSKEEQELIFNYLNRLNEVQIHKNNWRFFRVLTNVAFKKLGRTVDESKMAEDLDLMDDFYVADGWYFDGNRAQQDYYIPWAFHYYGLLYAYYMRDEDPERSGKLRKRATEFAQSFKYWFDENNGAGVAFGRSLIYRFAQSAFWSVCAFTDTEVIPWGEMKYILLKHFSYWEKQEIQKPDGILSIGYAYENHTMAERYNGPGSPYWSYKAFIAAALPEDHPFWQATAVSPKLDEKVRVPAAAMLITNQKGSNVQLFPAGQYSAQAHSDDKYSKFVYSSLFGFSIARGSGGVLQKAPDNTLAVSEVGVGHYLTKEATNEFTVTDDYTKQTWTPFPDVTIISWVVPLGDWHIRVHHVKNGRALNVSDGGFSNLTFNSHPKDYQILEKDGVVAFQSEIGATAGVSYEGYKQAEAIFPDPNTNLLFPNTVIFTCVGELPVGDHWLVSGHYGSLKEYTDVPEATLEGNQLKVVYGGEERNIGL